ncbi:MAG: aromatic amino acid DMT transporter YddG [Elusimicrobia bacterium]|nr:aromatic amino acid DMT transporter YddG [Elusimicrobiota bacterium]
MEDRAARSGAYTLLGIAAILLWSVTVGLARSLSEKVGPMSAGASVYLVAGLACRLRQGGTGRLPRRYVFGCGALFVFYLLAFYLAIGLARDRVEVLAVGLANYLWPSLTILFSLAVLRRKAGLLLVPGTLLALAGVLLAVADGSGVPVMELLAGSAAKPLTVGLAALGAVLWALYSNLTSAWMSESKESGVGLFMLATGGALLALSLLGLGPEAPAAGAWTARAVTEALALGLATGAGYECWEAAMRRGDVTLVASASYAAPLLSTVFSCLYLGVRPGSGLWLGCGLVVLGSVTSWKAVSTRPS